MKNILFFVGLLSLFILAGCGQQQSIESNSTTSQSLRSGSQAFSGNYKNYKNEKYDFSLQYPDAWQVDEDNSLAGPGFRPNDISMQDIQNGKIEKDKDCFFIINFLSAKQDKSLPCKNILGEATLGSNKFTKCSLAGSTSYMIIHPKVGNVLSVDYLDNPSCKPIVEKSLETLVFE